MKTLKELRAVILVFGVYVIFGVYQWVNIYASIRLERTYELGYRHMVLGAVLAGCEAVRYVRYFRNGRSPYKRIV